MIDVHAKVPSVEQDGWLDVMQGIYGGFLRLAMKKDLTPEELVMLCQAVVNAKNLHIQLLCFDSDLQEYRDQQQPPPGNHCHH